MLFLCASDPSSLSTPRKGVILRGGGGAHQFRTKSLVFLPLLIFLKMTTWIFCHLARVAVLAIVDIEREGGGESCSERGVE